MKNIIAKFGVPLMVALAVGNVYAQSYVGDTVTMSLIDSFPYAETGFTASLNGSQNFIKSDDLIGIYGFTINSINPNNITISSPFYSTCISPSGVLNYGQYSYTLQTFAQATPGLNPPAWASPALYPGAGIQNANYLFTQLAPTIYGGGNIAGESGSSADQAAAMVLAMYTALYNSTAYGSAVNGTVSSGFYANLSGSVLIDYGTDLNDLKGGATSIGNNLAPGYVLNPGGPTGSDSSGQEMVLGTGIPNLISTVPEPATLIAGALLLLPLGASTVRILRRNRGE